MLVKNRNEVQDRGDQAAKSADQSQSSQSSRAAIILIHFVCLLMVSHNLFIFRGQQRSDELSRKMPEFFPAPGGGLTTVIVPGVLSYLDK